MTYSHGNCCSCFVLRTNWRYVSTRKPDFIWLYFRKAALILTPISFLNIVGTFSRKLFSNDLCHLKSIMAFRIVKHVFGMEGDDFPRKVVSLCFKSYHFAVYEF